jgi:uncharacterized membrane protein YdcZ (DUF606 family)
LLSGGYLAAGVLLTNAAEGSQSASLARVVGANFFEHTLSYIVGPLVAVVAYLWTVREAP